MLERFPILSTHDFGAYSANALRFGPELRKMEPMEQAPFRGTFSAFRFGETKECSILESISSTIGLAVEHRESDDIRVFIPTTVRLQATCRTQMRELGNDGEAGLLSNREFVVRGTPGHLLILRANGRRVAAALREFDVEDDVASIVDNAFCDPSLAGLHDLATHIFHVIASIDHEADRVVNLKSYRAAHDELLVLRLAEILANAAKSAPARPVGHDDAAVRRAVHYIKEHAPDQIALTDLARYAGRSLRCLRLMFRRDFDCTITRFIQDERLAREHDRLVHARQGQTVAEIAYDSGFNHLGDFARVYGWTFRERPSETLQRTRHRALARSG